MNYQFSLWKICLVSLIGCSTLFAESGHPITFKRTKLPCEKKRVSPCGIRTFYLPRSQASNMARRLVGWKEYLPTCEGNAWGNFSFTTEYSRSRNGERIAQYLFGSTQLHFSGSQVPERNPRDLLADYFGLGTTFEGAIAFCPRIDNVILDSTFHLGLDSWCSGLYIQVNFPVVVTRWDLGIHCKEMNNITSQDAPVFPDCYMAPPPGPKDDPTETALSIREALSGEFKFGDMKLPLMFGAFTCGREQKTGVAEIDLILGYNAIADECSHLGIYFIGVAPTGNLPRGDIIFEPMVGNGRFWEFGAGVSAHQDLINWCSHRLSLYIDGIITHQIKRFQIRSFDLIGRGPLSRYMLLKEFDDTDQYNGTLINAIDFSTRSVRVGGSTKVDLAAKLAYYCGRWGLDLGYNLYARTKEKLSLRDDIFPSDLNARRFGIKGTEGVCYRVFNTDTDMVDETPSLNSVQNRATICSGSTVSNPEPILLQDPETAITWDSPTTPPFIQAQTSEPPIILSTDSLDIISGSVPHQLTHKFFFLLNYQADDVRGEPQFGIGGEIEFDGRSRILSGLEQWGVWFKVGFSF